VGASGCLIHLCDVSRVESGDELVGSDGSLLLRFLGLRLLLGGHHGSLVLLCLDLSVGGKVFEEVIFDLQENQAMEKWLPRLGC
jgi:hypothetical protein